MHFLNHACLNKKSKFGTNIFSLPSILEFIKCLMGTTWKREKKIMTIKCELFEHCRFIDNKDAKKLWTQIN
jgi:hypothetical protein